MTGIELSVAGILLGCFGLLMFALFVVALLRSLVWRKRASRSEAVMPGIREALVDYLAGSPDLTRIQDLARTSRRDVADAMISMQGTVGGSALDRLCDLALSLGLVHDWVNEAHSRDPVRRRAAFERLAFMSVYEPCRRVIGELLLQTLTDADPEVWLCSCRAVIQSGTGQQIETVFEHAVSSTLLIRILLTEALRRHAVPLCEHAVPEALRSRDPRRVLGALDILVAWERAIPIEHLRDLLEHPAKDIRIQALRLAPLVPLVPENRAAIVHSLTDPDPEISTAAALSAGRLQIAEALPLLARMLRLAPADLARTAASALAEMPPRGWQALEELSANTNPVTAAAAASALARARRKAGL
jgi:hypothetical protein